MKLLIKSIAVSLVLALSAQKAMSQMIEVSGSIIDKDQNIPLPFSSISFIQSKTKGVVSDAKGEFKIKIPKGAKVLFSMSGFEPTQMIFSEEPKEKITVYLIPKSSVQEEVLVQGYSKRSKSTVTGSSVSIKGKEVQDIPVSNVVELLQGKVAGLNIQNNNGTPGEMGTINLRGISSINITNDGFLAPTSPLFIIDGLYVDLNSKFEYELQSGVVGMNPLSLIPPDDIESIEVLKDAAATSVYGSRAAYGVIIINTKRGKSKEPLISYKPSVGRGGAQKGQKRIVIAGVNERLQRIQHILDNDTSLSSAIARIASLPILSDSLNPYYNNSINWQKYHDASNPILGNNLSISGGDERFNYKTNLNYTDQRGIIRNTGFKRYSLSLSFGFSPSRKLYINSNISANFGVQQLGSGNSLLQRGVANSSNASSLLPPPSIFSANSSALQSLQVDNSNSTRQIQSSFTIQYMPFTGITVQNDFSVGFNTGTLLSFVPALLNLNKSATDQSSNFFQTYNERLNVTYNKTINGEHNLAVFTFGEFALTENNTNTIKLIQTPSDQLRGPIGYNLKLSGGGSGISYNQQRTSGTGGGVSYNYKLKYVFDLTLRRDGTSANGRNNPFSFSPSVSGRWNFSKENIFKKIDWIETGGFRASWGKSITPTGDQFSLTGEYLNATTYDGHQTVVINEGILPGIDAKPTTTTNLNFGFDLSVFGNKLRLTIDHYFRQIDNLAKSIRLPVNSGFKQTTNTETSLVNYGTELAVNYTIIDNPKKQLLWTTNFVGEIRRDILTRLPLGLRQLQSNLTSSVTGTEVPVVNRIGLNAISNLLYYTRGIYTNTSDVPINVLTGERKQLDHGKGYYFQAGDPNWVDINGDYIIDQDDLKPLGNPIPRLTGGISTEVRYRFLTLNIQTVYTMLRDVLNFSLENRLSSYSEIYVGDRYKTSALYPLDDFDYWKPGSDKSIGLKDAKYPNPFDFTRGRFMHPYRGNQTLFLEDGSFWKIKSIILGINLSKKMMSKIYFPWGIRVAFSINNVATFTNYSGSDPENVSSLGRDNSDGFPLAKTFAVTFNFQF